MTRRPSYDPRRFDKRRYTDANVGFWAPRFVDKGRIHDGDVVVDLGCGTGGFTSALPAPAVGIERDETLATHGKAVHPALRVVVGDIGRLPIRTASIDVALASLVLHQVELEPAVDEVARVLRPFGRLVVRTVAPEDAARWVPHRWFPTVAAHQAERMPSIGAMEAVFVRAGLECIDVSKVERQRRLAAADAALRDIVPRYDLTAAEVDEGIAQIRAADGSGYVQAHTVLVAVKPPDT